MIDICRTGLSSIDLHLNNNKSVCLRVGPTHAVFSALLTTDGAQFEFKKELKYLGCTLLSGSSFACSLQLGKTKF